MFNRSHKVFYGWWVVGASFFIALYVGGVIFYGFTAIFEPLANEFGWSYAQISLAVSLRGLESSLFAPVAGMITEWWGPRRLIFSGVIITVAGLILLSATTSLGIFYGAFVLIAIGMSACTMPVLMIAIANWFQAKIGIASGIAICGFALGGLAVPVIVKLIDVYEWRMTITILAIGMVVMVLPLSLVFRHKPEQYGYFPDGQVQHCATYHDGSLSQDMKTMQALKSGTFWCLALAFTYHMMVTSAIITHVMPYLSSIGIGRSNSSLVATAIPLLSIGGRLGLGWLGDKAGGRLAAVGTFTMMGLGCFCLGYISSAGTWLFIPFVILFGFSYGGCIALRSVLAMEYFGRTSFGTFLGLIIGIGGLGSIIGPTLAGWVYDNFGSYQGIWFVFAGLATVAIVSVLTIPTVSRGRIERAK